MAILIVGPFSHDSRLVSLMTFVMEPLGNWGDSRSGRGGINVPFMAPSSFSCIAQINYAEIFLLRAIRSEFSILSFTFLILFKNKVQFTLWVGLLSSLWEDFLVKRLPYCVEWIVTFSDNDRLFCQGHVRIYGENGYILRLCHWNWNV